MNAIAFTHDQVEYRLRLGQRNSTKHVFQERRDPAEGCVRCSFVRGSGDTVGCALLWITTDGRYRSHN